MCPQELLVSTKSIPEEEGGRPAEWVGPLDGGKGSIMTLMQKAFIRPIRIGAS